MAISKWIGGIIILVAFVFAGKIQAQTFDLNGHVEQQLSLMNSQLSQK